MLPRFRTAGAEIALSALGLKKEAFLGTAIKYLAAKPALAAIGKSTARQALGGAAATGAIMGGIGAATAPEGQRMEAFGRGATQGAGMGFIGGAAMGAGGEALRQGAGALGNRVLAKRLAEGALAPGALGPKLPETVDLMHRGLWTNAKELAKGTGRMGRSGSAIGLAGRVGELSVEAAPMLALPTSMGGMGWLSKSSPEQVPTPEEQYPPEMYRTASDEASQLETAPVPGYTPPILPARTVGSALGGLTVGLGTAIPLIVLKNRLPAGAIPPWYLGDVARRVIPSVAGTAGAIGGGILGQHISPDQPVYMAQPLDGNK